MEADSVTVQRGTEFFNLAKDQLAAWGLSGTLLEVLTWLAMAVIAVILAMIASFLARQVLLRALTRLIVKSKTKWDDALIERKVLFRIAQIAPALVFYWYSGIFPGAEDIIRRLALIYMIVMSGVALSSLMNAFMDVYKTLPSSHNKPIKGYVQLVQIFVYIVVAILALALILRQSPTGLLTGLGAMTAVLLLVFKDSILGLVASFQISGNDMVRIDDWIEMPSFGADGDVIDVSLHTVKVRNWDKTISTIPTYALISNSFKNWRGMSESGGRRIKRSINIDMTTVKFCDKEMIERFRKFHFLSDYIDEKIEEVSRYNEEQKVDTSYLINGRHLTNLGTFRAYLSNYLRKHPKVHQNLTFMVRQLAPGDKGVPIEVYVFSTDQRWVYYEEIQSDIFDHIIAVIPLFDLKIFQSPSGTDVRSVVEKLPTGEKQD